MLLSIIVPVILSVTILILFWIMPTLVPDTLPFGVRIPPQRRQEVAIAQIRRDYYIGLAIIAVVIELGAVLLLQLFQAFGIFFAAFIIEFVLVALNYYIAHRRLRQAKEQGQWYAGLHQAVVADTQPVAPEPLPRLWLLLAFLPLVVMVILSIVRYPALPAQIPTHFGLDGIPNQWSSKASGVWWLPVISLVLTVMLVFLARQLSRQRGSLDPADIEGSRQRAAEMAKLSGPLLLAITGLVNLTLLFTALMILQILPEASNGLVSVIVLLPMLVIIALCVFIMRKRRARQSGQVESRYVQRDDDRYWVAGMFYLNKDDPALFVEKRSGLGWTINLGNPIGLIAMVAILGIIVFAFTLKNLH